MAIAHCISGPTRYINLSAGPTRFWPGVVVAGITLEDVEVLANDDGVVTYADEPADEAPAKKAQGRKRATRLAKKDASEASEAD